MSVFVDAQNVRVEPLGDTDHGSSFWVPVDPGRGYICCPARTGRTWRGTPPGYDRGFDEAQRQSWKDGARSDSEIMFEVDSTQPGTEGWRK